MFATDAEKKEFQSAALSAVNTCLGIFIGLWLIPFLFAFAYYPLPTFVSLTVFLLFLFALIPAWSVPGSPFSAGMTVCVLGSTFAGLRVFYGDVLPLKALEEGRAYTGVYAQQSAVAFSDASILSFTGNATVDDSRAGSLTVLEGGPVTYCVAPISDPTSSGRVEFWAVGLDCCPGKLASFECDRADSPGATTGAVVPDLQEVDRMYDVFGKYLAPADVRRDLFLQAIKIAEAAHEVESSTRPILVRWVSETRRELAAAKWRSITLALVVSFFVIGLAALLLTMLAVNQQVTSRVWRSWAMGLDRPADANRPKVAPHLADFRQICVLGFVVPYLTIMSSVILWSWMYCYTFGTMYAVAFVSFLGMVVGPLLLTGQTFAYGIVTLFCAILGGYVGRRNYFNNTFHYCASRGRRSYTNVYPDGDGLQFQDAGKMQFVLDAGASGLQSVGFTYDGTLYCAAPILSSECASSGSCGCTSDSCAVGSSSLPAHTDFWAVGVDCCDDVGGFRCGGGVNSSIADRFGLVLRDSAEQGVKDAARLPYMRAVQAASDKFGLVAPEQPVLIQWSDGSGGADSVERLWVGRAIVVILATAALGFCSLSCLVCVALGRSRPRCRAPPKGVDQRSSCIGRRCLAPVRQRFQ